MASGGAEVIAAVHSCPICLNEARFIGKRPGRLDNREYTYFHCASCHFSFINNPRTDYENIYSEAYYRGRGADPMVDYVYELEKPDLTIRNYESRGVFSIFNELVPHGGRWLDFGCGVGGLVAFAKRRGIDIVGFEEGWGAQAGRLKNIPILTANELKAEESKFDFVSAIEVMEHTVDPLAVLKLIRSILKPGGVFFLTTGNSKPWRGRLLDWVYTACPEVHVSFFEPETLALAFQKAGFEAKQGRFFGGLADVIKFKVLKAMRVKNIHPLIDILPWRLISTIVDSRHRISEQPYAVAIRHE
jgi:SAM-dependent methyltransferase